jgi:hypothetical protein
MSGKPPRAAEIDWHGDLQTYLAPESEVIQITIYRSVAQLTPGSAPASTGGTAPLVLPEDGIPQTSAASALCTPTTPEVGQPGFSSDRSKIFELNDPPKKNRVAGVVALAGVSLLSPS